MSSRRSVARSRTDSSKTGSAHCRSDSPGTDPMATGIDFDWSEFHFVFGAESAEFWRPLAVTIIFGLTISTFLTLVIVPTVYSFLDEWTEKAKALFTRSREPKRRDGTI